MFYPSNCLLLEDDTKIYKLVKCLDEALKLQCDLNSLYQWCKVYANYMPLNR